MGQRERRREPGRRRSPGCGLLDDGDLLFGQPAKLADEGVDLPIGRLDRAREAGLLGARSIVSASRLPEASI